MTLEQKNRTIFFPAVFINDSEENIQAMERLLKDTIYWIDFFS
jgi:hypothetical protein